MLLPHFSGGCFHQNVANFRLAYALTGETMASMVSIARGGDQSASQSHSH